MFSTSSLNLTAISGYLKIKHTLKSIFVMDRGYDARVILEYLYEKDLSFIITYNGEKKKVYLWYEAAKNGVTPENVTT